MPALRDYCVRLLHDSRPREVVVRGASFEDAALAFAEDHHPAADDHGEVAVMVRDLAGGGEQCFRLEMETGKAAPCA